VFEKQSRRINPRNPFVKDEQTVNYDMDSEDEWNEMHYDDIEND
jgi:hypothetical protein